MVNETHIGKRVRFLGFIDGGMSRTGTLTNIEGTGMCRAMVTLDIPHERKGANWAFAQSDLQPIE